MLKKSVRRSVKLSSILLIAIFALMGQSLVTAQPSTDEVEIVGTISTLTAQTLTIGTQTFDITRAEIKAGVVAGTLVKIHAAPSATGIWVVREVELARVNITQTPSPETTPEITPEATQQPSPEGEFEITGQITSFTATTIVIGGQTIDTSNAQIKDALSLNEVVKVHVSVVNGVWVAWEVEAASTTVTGTLIPTLQAEDGRHGQDDGSGHDVNDDQGDHNGNDDNSNHGGNNNNQGNNDNNTDNHGGNSGGSDDGSSGHNGDDSGGHGHG